MILTLIAALQTLPSNEQLASQVDPKRLQATIERLASWPNRNTNNPTLTEAADYLAGELRKIPGLNVEIMHYTAPKGQRVPVEKDVVEVVATLPGRTDHRVLVGGHFDTINMVDRGNLDARAPGANDDGSGTALTLELARVLSQRKWNNTLVFVCFSGEEQGLLGSTALARRAKRENWNIDAVLSNDIVGDGEALNGQKDKRHVRVFSEESPDHNSRELARFIEWTTRGKLHGFSPNLVFRRDRFQRGGDHTSFNREGFTAVRFSESFEMFAHQHSDQDLPKYVDYRYTANVARVNLLAMASLADADEAPTGVRYDPRQTYDTTLSWTAKPGVKYVVYWRPTNSPTWTGYRVVGGVNKATIEKVNKDDYEFAVGALDGVPVAAK